MKNTTLCGKILHFVVNYAFCGTISHFCGTISHFCDTISHFVVLLWYICGIFVIYICGIFCYGKIAWKVYKTQAKSH